MKEESRLPGVIRDAPPCKNCGERHTACWDSCQKYKAWKAEAERIKEAEKAYKEAQYKAYEEENRRNA